MRHGQWNKQKFANCLGLKSRSLGVIGVGNIGWEVVKRAKAFDMKINIWSNSLNDIDCNQLGLTKINDMKEIAKKSDFVTLHVPNIP